MSKLSATILTHNEASHIEACLDSLRQVADEIVVVDSFSTDSTVQICQAHGCKVTQRRMTGFGAQRQYATSLTSHPYVLALDADEALSPALRNSILELKSQGFGHRGYKMPRLNFFCGYAVKHAGWYPDHQVRLFDKRYASWSLSEINEEVIFRDDVRPQLLEGDILHFRCSTRTEFQIRSIRQAEIRAARLATSPEKVGLWRPTFEGLRHFFNSYIAGRGILDGAIGFAISRQHYLSTRHAYKKARKLQKTSHHANKH